MVAKKRGTGMREQNASATVYEMKDGEWRLSPPLQRSIRDTVPTNHRFRKDQFTQVVLYRKGSSENY